MTGELHRELLEIVKNRQPGVPTHVDFHAERPPAPPAPAPEPEPVDQQPIHAYFGLSYANYLVLPRSVLQSMPSLWQASFVGLLKELAEEWAGPPENTAYDVALLDGNPRNPDYQVADELAEYDRGRRQVPLKSYSDSEYMRARTERDRAQAELLLAARRARVAEARLTTLANKIIEPLERLLRERKGE